MHHSHTYITYHIGRRQYSHSRCSSPLPHVHRSHTYITCHIDRRHYNHRRYSSPLQISSSYPSSSPPSLAYHHNPTVIRNRSSQAYCDPADPRRRRCIRFRYHAECSCRKARQVHCAHGTRWPSRPHEATCHDARWQSRIHEAAYSGEEDRHQSERHRVGDSSRPGLDTRLAHAPVVRCI